MVNGDVSDKATRLIEKLIDKSTEQEHIPFLAAIVIMLLWATLSGVFLRGWALLISLASLGIILLALYIVYTQYGKKKKARNLLFNEIIDYFKSNFNAKKYITSSSNPDLNIIGLQTNKGKSTLIIQTNEKDNNFKKNLVFDLIKIDKSRFNNKDFEFPTTFAYVKITGVGENSQCDLIEVFPTEKKYYKEILKGLKNNSTRPIENWRVKCHIDSEFENASLEDIENAYSLLLKIRDAED